MIKNILVSTNTSASSFICRIASNCIITLDTGVLHCQGIATESRQNLVALFRIAKRRISMLSVQRRKIAHSFYWIVKVNLF